MKLRWLIVGMIVVLCAWSWYLLWNYHHLDHVISYNIVFSSPESALQLTASGTVETLSWIQQINSTLNYEKNNKLNRYADLVIDYKTNTQQIIGIRITALTGTDHLNYAGHVFIEDVVLPYQDKNLLKEQDNVPELSIDQYSSPISTRFTRSIGRKDTNNNMAEFIVGGKKRCLRSSLLTTHYKCSIQAHYELWAILLWPTLEGKLEGTLQQTILK